MANEITSMIMAQAPSLAKGTGQVVKLVADNVPQAGGQELPIKGKGLPVEGNGQVAKQSELHEAVNRINTYVQSVQRDLSFSMDETSGHTIIKVIDSESGKLVRQIPSEEVLALATFIQSASDTGSTGGEIPPGMIFSDSI